MRMCCFPVCSNNTLSLQRIFYYKKPSYICFVNPLSCIFYVFGTRCELMHLNVSPSIHYLGQFRLVNYWLTRLFNKMVDGYQLCAKPSPREVLTCDKTLGGSWAQGLTLFALSPQHPSPSLSSAVRRGLFFPFSGVLCAQLQHFCLRPSLSLQL